MCGEALSESPPSLKADNPTFAVPLPVNAALHLSSLPELPGAVGTHCVPATLLSLPWRSCPWPCAITPSWLAHLEILTWKGYFWLGALPHRMVTGWILPWQVRGQSGQHPGVASGCSPSQVPKPMRCFWKTSINIHICAWLQVISCCNIDIIPLAVRKKL